MSLINLHKIEGPHNPLDHVDGKVFLIVAGVGVLAAGLYFHRNVYPNLSEPQQHAVGGMLALGVLLAGLARAGMEFKNIFSEIGVPELETD